MTSPFLQFPCGVSLVTQSWLWSRKIQLQKCPYSAWTILKDIILYSSSILDREEMGKDSKNYKNKHQTLKEEWNCTELDVPTAETPLQSSKSHQRLSEKSSRRFQQQQGQLHAKVYLCLLFQSHFATWGVKSQKCLTHFYFSKPSFSHQLLHLILWQYFPRANWSYLPKITQEESSQKALNCALVCGTAPFGPKLVQAGALDYKIPEQLTLINILLHLTELPLYLPQDGGNILCFEPHSSIFSQEDWACFWIHHSGNSVVISHLLGFGRWRSWRPFPALIIL